MRTRVTVVVFGQELEGDLTLCRSCRAEIVWVVSPKSGKKMPVNRDGKSHFATCPQAEEWGRAGVDGASPVQRG